MGFNPNERTNHGTTVFPQTENAEIVTVFPDSCTEIAEMVGVSENDRSIVFTDEPVRIFRLISIDGRRRLEQGEILRSDPVGGRGISAQP